MLETAARPSHFVNRCTLGAFRLPKKTEASVENAMGNTVSGLEPWTRRDELAALAVLIASKSLRIERLAAEVEALESAVVVLDRIQRESVLAPKFDDGDIRRALSEVDGWIAAGRDVRAVFDRSYPLNLRDVFNKPPLLFLKGMWMPHRDDLSVAVVGTRKATSDGLKRARETATRLAEAGVTVVSGLAAGIDTAAHIAALDAGGRTVAVMGTGIDRVYPRENAALADRIVAAGGALVSQFFPDHPPNPASFPLRNIVMSGLSLATFVIEASETSGAKMQARLALHHGRAVFLPTSLVQQHEWARKMVEIGIGGAHAVSVESVEEVIERFVGAPYEAPSFAAM
jgi:DNA processing protein